MIRTYIWHSQLEQAQNSETSFLGSVLGFGHAAIEIVDSSYISKWPKGKTNGYGYTMDYEEDIDLCGRKADEIIEIKNLNEKAMEEYWESVRYKEFNNIFRNCCRIAGKAIEHGYYWSYFRSLDTYFKRLRCTYVHFGETAYNDGALYLSKLTSWTPYDVSTFAKYIKKMSE